MEHGEVTLRAEARGDSSLELSAVRERLLNPGCGGGKGITYAHEESDVNYCLARPGTQRFHLPPEDGVQAMLSRPLLAGPLLPP